MPDNAHDERFLRSSVLFVFAHPDDETLGASLQLAKFAGRCTVLHTTDGAPRNGEDARAHGFATVAEYAAARRAELQAAMRLVGVPERELRSLGVPDQQAAHDLARLTRLVHEQIRELQPKFVFTHAYEGGHPDHDATAFAVQQAVALFGRQGGMVPAVLEVPLYSAAGEGRAELVFAGEAEAAPVLLTPDGPALERKRQMIACYRSQQETLRHFPLDREAFRPAPAHDFTQPPPAGGCYYDRFPWGISGEQFRANASCAQAALTAAAAWD